MMVLIGHAGRPPLAYSIVVLDLEVRATVRTARPLESCLLVELRAASVAFRELASKLLLVLSFWSGTEVSCRSGTASH